MVTQQQDLNTMPGLSKTNNLGFWQQIKEDWIAHGCDWTKPGFRAVAIHRFGVWRMKIKPKKYFLKTARAPVNRSGTHFKKKTR